MYFILLALTSSLFCLRVDCQSGVVLAFSASDLIDGTSRIVEGARLVFACQVTSDFMHGRDTLRIDKLSNEGMYTKLASSTDAINPNFLSWSNNILQIIMYGISKYDGGNYQCSAERQVNPDQIVSIGYLTITVDVLYPSSGVPVCKTSSAIKTDSIVHSGDEITLQCTSDVGNPAVTLEWSNEMDIEIKDTEMELLLNSTILNITVILDSVNSGVTFSCLRLNSEFPLNQQACAIGPLVVQERPEVTSLMPVTSQTAAVEILSTKISSTSAITAPSAAVVGVGVIATIVVVIIIGIAIIMIIIIAFLRVRSGQCKSIIKSNRDGSDAENVTLDAGYNTGNPHMHIDNHGGNSAAEGENYTGLQINTLENRGDKVYQDLLPKPLSPTKSGETDGDQRANAGMASLQAEASDYVVKCVSHKTMNASQDDSGAYEDIDELPEESYKEIPGKCYEAIPESRSGISSIPAAAQEANSVVHHVYLDFTGGETDTNEGVPEAAASMPDQHDQQSSVHGNSSNEVVYANQTRVQDFKLARNWQHPS